MTRTKTSTGKRIAAAVLAWSVATAGCGEREPGPVAAAKQYMRIVKSRSVEDLVELMTESARKQLERGASAASDQIGGRRNVAPTEMLQLVEFDERFRVFEAELVDESERAAIVRITGSEGAELELELRREDGRWRVVLPGLVAGAAED